MASTSKVSVSPSTALALGMLPSTRLLRVQCVLALEVADELELGEHGGRALLRRDIAPLWRRAPSWRSGPRRSRDRAPWPPGQGAHLKQ
eukprot:807317-Pyramimonas_sp.AAC.1